MREITVLEKKKVYNTNFLIPEDLLGKRVLVYNGRQFISLLIREDHINGRLGNFIITKRQGYRIHKKKKPTNKK